MRKIRVLFFAADPLSAPPHGTAARLRLDEDVRQIRAKVRAAAHRDAVEFDVRWAVRTDDLLQALAETHPQVVHFSAHGTRDGALLLADREGVHPQPVSAAALAKLFRAFLGDLRLVVLNACHSHSHAKAVAEVVGCAIGMRGRIPDEAAITFAASFYRAIAFGESVAAAHEQACAALALEYEAESPRPELFVRPGVDPADLVLVHGRRPMSASRRAAAVLAGVLALSSAGVLATRGGEDPAASRILPLVTEAQGVPAPAPPQGGDPLADAHALRTAGNHAAALPLFQRAAEAGNPEAMAFLGVAYLSGEGGRADTVLAIHWLRLGARKGDRLAMTALGAAHRVGAGVSRSDRYARLWLGRAATEGHAPAMRELGHMEVDAGRHAEARAWYRRAVDAGSADARADLGMMRERGWGVPAEADRALEWYLSAAERGSAAGMVGAGRLLQGRGDHAAAHAWYRRGADAGSPEAMNNLGILYLEGVGVRRDRAEAVRWFRRAAATGSAVAAANLAALGG